MKRSNLLIKGISPGDLDIGLFVIIPGSWLKHRFLRSQFALHSMSQLEQLVKAGLKEVWVDPSRSDKAALQSWNEKRENSGCSDTWNSETLIPKDLSLVLRDTRMKAEQKAEAIHGHSREMMRRLLQAPTVENIDAAKNAIRKIADSVLSEPSVAKALVCITSHDFYTFTHSVSVGVKGLLVARELFPESSQKVLQDYAIAFFLHDLGKVDVPHHIINKTGQLTDQEMDVMRRHPQAGFEKLRKAGEISESTRVIVLQHHERPDGRGYPNHLKASDIHPLARICTCVDVFDALTAKRSYKRALRSDEALKILEKEIIAPGEQSLLHAVVHTLMPDQAPILPK